LRSGCVQWLQLFETTTACGYGSGSRSLCSLGRDDVELILPTIMIGITAHDKHPQSLAAARA
jgi:hypothetical protein